jgi:hypothetical protein
MSRQHPLSNSGIITSIDEYLDSEVGEQYRFHPLAQDWARVSKIGEEYGEAVNALIGITAQNPRKGYYSSREELIKELLDVAATALVAVEHFTKDGCTWERLQDHIAYLKGRVNA